MIFRLRWIFLYAFALFLCLQSYGDNFLEKVDWEKLRSLPIQSKGRIKPLESYARLMLFKFSGQIYITTEKQELDACQWLMYVLFLDADKIPVFRIQDLKIKKFLKLKDEARFYSYDQLMKEKKLLIQTAVKAYRIHRIKRSKIQEKILPLFEKIIQFYILKNSFAFFRRNLLPTEDIAKEMKKNPCLMDYLKFIRSEKKSKRILLMAKNDMNRKIQKIHALEFMCPPRQKMRMSHWTIFPPKNLEKKRWASSWDIFHLYKEKMQHQEEITSWRKLYLAFQAKDAKKINEALSILHKKIVNLAKKRKEYSRVLLERNYYRYDLFQYALYCYLTCILLGGFCINEKWRKHIYAFVLFIACIGFFLHTYGILFRMQIKQRPPVSNSYEAILFTCWMSVFIGFFLEIFFRKTHKAIAINSSSIVAVILLYIASQSAYKKDNFGVLMAILDTNFWLATHVTTILIGYGATLLAGMIAHFFVIKQNFFPEKNSLDKMIYAALSCGLLFTFLGTILGGIWADQSWGRFWGWDPKENGAFLIILWLLVLLHARKGGYIQKNGFALGAILANLVVVAAWWGVNLLNVGLHRYGANKNLAKNLLVFTSIEIMIVLIGFLMPKIRHFSQKGQWKE